MTILAHRPDPTTAAPQHRRPRRLAALAVGLLVVTLATGAGLEAATRERTSDLRRSYLTAGGWPAFGEAAYRAGTTTRVGPEQDPVPIASLAKVMTAYVVLQSFPLRGDAQGPEITVTDADVRDWARRRRRDESVVRVAAGEHLTERQALGALLIPSANNVATMLARFAAGSSTEFVARMNALAGRLGMAQTHYTDPSGFDPRTVSSAQDQLTLAVAVAGNPVISELAARTSYPLPVVGIVHSTDALLGHDGFAGTKTGSDDAAGGCFMFRTTRVVRGQIVDVLGVVLGQHGRHLVTAGLTAARQLADRIGPAAQG